MDTESVTVNLPVEYFDALLAVMASGLDHAQIPTETRRQLQAWWEAEQEFIRDEITGANE